MSPPPLETSQSLKISSNAPQDSFLFKLSYLLVSPQPKLSKKTPPLQFQDSASNRQFYWDVCT
ncbi:hypothetical protein HKD37_02G004724 [Glycine soja]